MGEGEYEGLEGLDLAVYNDGSSGRRPGRPNFNEMVEINIKPEMEVVTECKRSATRHPVRILILLLSKLVLNLLGIICMACTSPALLNGTHWFLFVAVLSFIATLIWVFIYLLSIKEALTLPINWLLTEVLNTAIIAILYLVAFIVQLTVWSSVVGSPRGPNIAAGVFGIFNTIAYGYGTYLLYAEWKASSTSS